MTLYFEEEILRYVENELENYTTDEERNNALMVAAEMANQIPTQMDWQEIYERLYKKYNEAGERIYWSKIMKPSFNEAAKAMKGSYDLIQTMIKDVATSHPSVRTKSIQPST
jgi:hypothetical protein